jgi:hypothetical integral membrane protein (TIGR02206 family)
MTAAGIAVLLAGCAQVARTDDRWLRRALALALLANQATGWGVAAWQGVVRVPLQLCDLAVVLTAWALWSLRPAVSHLAYFWGLGGSLQAILTPDLAWAFPDYWWIKFFVNHCGVVWSVVFLAATGRVRPRHRTVWRVFALTNLYAAGVGMLNGLLGTNFGYLAHKPAQPSLLDYFGPWPYYILGMEVAAVASFYLCYAPFALARRSARRTR